MITVSITLWYTLTVIIPGLVLYGSFRVLVGLFEIQLPWLETIDGSVILTVSVVIAIGMLVQVLGIALEDVLFKRGPYKHKKGFCARCNNHKGSELQDAFNRRYEILALFPEKASRVEYILGQFFMSHNIAIGMTIIISWLAFKLWGRYSAEFNVLLLIVMVIALGLLWYIPYNRFHMSSDALFVFEKRMNTESKKQQPLKEAHN